MKERIDHSARVFKRERGILGLCLFLVFFLLLNPGSRVNAEGISGGDNEEISVDPTGEAEGYSAVLYDNTNGLPTSESNAIAETSEGFIWIGSYSGLIRYDGNTFERIDSTTGITSVVSLYVDSKDRLWIGTNDNGVAMMQKGKVKLFKDVEGLKSSSIRSFVEDSNGNIYVATTHGMGMIDSDLNLHAIDESQVNQEYICELRKGADKVIYGETMEGAVFTMKDGALTGFYDGNKLGIGAIASVRPDPKNPGYVYLGTERSEIYYGELESGMKDATVINVDPLTYINSIECFEDDIWICADNGVGMVHEGKFSKLKNIPMNNSVDKMLLDYEGNLWFTSSRQGVMKIVPNQFTDLFERYSIESRVVNSTCMYDNRLFVGTDTGLIIIGPNSVEGTFPITKMATEGIDPEKSGDLVKLLRNCRIRSVIRDNEDRLWFSTYSDMGLVCFDHGTVYVFRQESGLPSERIRTVYERKDGVIMVVCSGGLALIDGMQVKDVYNEKSGISNDEILTAVEAENGDMILGSDGDGIYIVNDRKVQNIGLESGLGSEVVMRIKKDEKRKLYWIVTSNSLAYMTEDYKVTPIYRFPYSNNFDMYEDDNGKMWVLSSNGIYVVSVQELLDNQELNTVFYSMDNGVPCVTTANSYSERTEDGDLYISGNVGVAKVNIDKTFEDVNELKMAVPYVEADGDIIYAADDGSITISSDVKRLTVYSFVYTYSLINPQVTYRLEGFDQESTTVSRSELEPVDYTNLDGGEYHFVMNLKDSMGRGNKELSVLIVKEKSIFEETWFMVVAGIVIALILGLIIAIYVRMRMKALLKKERENKIFIREMIEAFAKTIDMKDKYTNGHSTRVAEYTAMLSRELGYDDETVEKYTNIALLHDIGKIGVPPEVLNKPGKLTDEEFKIIKSHSSLGYRVLKDISIMPELAVGAGAHHERPDGKGYPKGLKGDEIPRVAQIIAVADTFDAMYSDRPYRKRMNFDKAVSIIKEVSGTQLESDVVDAFLRLVEQGEFRAPDDVGGGTTEDIDNIHKRQDKEAKEKQESKEHGAQKQEGQKQENDTQK